MEGTRVLAVTHRGDCAIALAEGNPGGRGEARGVIEAVAEALPEPELVAHEQGPGGHTAVVWVGSPADAAALEVDFRRLRGPGGEWKLVVEKGAAFVSLVGLGLGAAEVVRAEAALERAGVSLVALRATPNALIFRVASERVEDAVRALHGAFFPS